MSTSFGPLLQFALVIGFVMAIALSLLIACIERPLRRVLASKSPRQRVRILYGLLMAPALLGLGYVLMTLSVPSLFGNSAWLAAACHGHADNLWHLCLWHPSDRGQSAWLWAALVLWLGYAAWLAGRAATALWRHRRRLAALLRLSRRSGPAGHFRVVEADQPMAMACGVARRHVLLSTALLERLDARQLQVVLAHEQAHHSHRDVFWRLLAGVLSWIQLPGPRQRLSRDLALALEQRCDRFAAESVGCPVVVAETIVTVRKMLRQDVPLQSPLGLAFISDFVSERVQALLAPPPTASSWLDVLLVTGLFSFCLVSIGWLHRIAEVLIAVLPG